MTRFASRAALALGLLAAVAAGAAAQARNDRTVYAVIVGDTNSSDICDGVKKDCEVVAALLNSVSGETVQISRLTGNDVTHARFEALVGSLPIRPGDALVCFIACHGGTTADRDAQHFLQFTGQRAATGKPEYIARATIRDILTRKRARLTVLLTDACSNRCAITLPPASRGVRPPKVLAPGQVRPCFTKLFLEAEGVVDIGGSFTNTYAWFHDTEGGVFTRALDVALRDLQDKDDLTWAGFYGQLKDETERTFDAWKKRWLDNLGDPANLSPAAREAVKMLQEQESQTTQVFFLAGTRLKLIFKDGKVTDMPEDSPARKAGMRINDVIEEVDGKKFRTDDELYDLLATALAARSDAAIKVGVRRGSESYELTIRLSAPK